MRTPLRKRFSQALEASQVGLSTGGMFIVDSGVPAGNRKPFASSSFYNVTFAQRYGSNEAVPIHPENDLILEGMRMSIDFDTGALLPGRHFRWTTDTSQFTPAVYIPTALTPLETIHYNGVRGESSDASTTRFTGGGNVLNVPVDPTWKVPSGDDGQIVIWDRDNILNHANGAQFWDMWQCVPAGGLGTEGLWVKNGSGQYVCQNMSHFVGEPTSSGIPGNTPSAYVSRGAGSPYMAGHTFAWELEAAAAVEGTLSHALVGAFSSPSGTYSPPASKSDGASAGQGDNPPGQPYSAPEGAFLKLNERVDIDGIPSAKGRVLARTIRDRGLMIGDNAGRPKLYLEADVSANSQAGWASTDVNLISEIPIEMLHVVDWVGGDTGRANTDSGWGTGVQEFTAALTGGIAGTPAQVGSTVTGTAASATTVVTGSQTPLVNELLLMIALINNNEDAFFENCNGNGLTAGWGANQWRSYSRHGNTATGERTLCVETQVARASSGVSAGAVTITSRTEGGTITTPKSAQAMRFTADSKVIHVVHADHFTTRTTTPSARIITPANGNLLVGIICSYRANATCNNDATGWTANTLNTSPSAANVNGPKLSTFTRVADGSTMTLAPTLGATSEWIVMILEIT